jgi:hypothetical protein
MEKQKRMTRHKRRQDRFNIHFHNLRSLKINEIWNSYNKEYIISMMLICEYYDKKNRNTIMMRNFMTESLENSTIWQFINKHNYWAHFGLEDEE